MRKCLITCLTIMLLMMFSISVSAETETPYVIDDANLLTQEQRQELNTYAEEITETYGIGIYLMAVNDYHNYGEESGIFDVLWNYYHDNALGYGDQRQGMILMISMAERDWATFFYGEDTEYAFNGFGQKKLEKYYLEGFSQDDWYGGFLGYLTAAEGFMAKAATGEPVQNNPWLLSGVFVLIVVFISYIITRRLWMRRETVTEQKGAEQYKTAKGLVLTHEAERYITQSIIRTPRIKMDDYSDSDDSFISTSQSYSGGGGSGRSGKF